ncbi:phospholipase C, phosphocholine-specific [Chitinophaga lutea]|uniref:phospholipase C n=1 Tax=Chitinophaga lutea TaxID=2488634 RepID=A0A3N4PKP4_9BACT|nr:phospholipase C, phosphocholine-specific [Chitinophaga lutea]RPE09252.1 phospholipase C, phosphocholine-specific [Chitinophaga lutea]
MDTRRDFLRKSILLSGAAGMSTVLPGSIQRALAIDPQPGSTFLDAEHVVILMQENRSFDHCFGTLRGVRGLNDPRAITLPDRKSVYLQTNEQGETYGPFRLDIKDTKVTWMGALPHSRASQVDANNLGKYDKWLPAKKPGNKQYAHMPLTMGYYTREDLPFNYAMADAFTVCDQNFCSAMTSTTPNRSFFWTGKIMSEENGAPKANIRNDNFSYGKFNWGTFPELLEENGVAWKFYQNDVSCGGGFVGEERSWLANFGCNLLEFFEPYQVKFTERYVKNLQLQIDTLPAEINALEEATPSTEAAAKKNKAAIAKKQEALASARAELDKWNALTRSKLTGKDKSLHERAFVINSADPQFRKLSKMNYQDGNASREVTVPAGDILYQFRKDVNEGKLPTVSWLASPQNFSDHPSAPWYGAWYVSEVLDILTKNPEVWKKTIFIVTYDENDGYFDHVPPFSIPDDAKTGTGKCSPGIDTEIEHVRLENELKQGVPPKAARGGAVGLGFRVPMLIASPWSRGGKVCSQVFDHTSTLQFLETFVNRKFNKNICTENISAWRRTICGDLTSAFTPFDGTKPPAIPFINRDQIVRDIYNAKFRQDPGGFKKLSDEEARQLTLKPALYQEPGQRPSTALPYELYADGKWNAEKKTFDIEMAAALHLGEEGVGAPYTVYAPVVYKDENGQEDVCRNWYFAVKRGDKLSYSWPAAAFDKERYHLRLHGPNGFYREFKGKDPVLQVVCEDELDPKIKKPTGYLQLSLLNTGSADTITVVIRDNAYGQKDIVRKVSRGKKESIVLPLNKSNYWYDFSVSVQGDDHFEQRYAGRAENGREGLSDPAIGRKA